jgi:hypothetical protein
LSAPRSSTEHDPLDAADTPRTAPTWQAWLEVAALAGLVTAAHMICGLGAPWLAVAPLLAGLRYGSSRGVVCAALQVAALAAVAHWQVAVDAPTGQAILGWLIAGLVPGQFCDAWTRRLRGLEIRVGDASLRLASLARAYHLVVASHERLARENPSSPSSLREALEALARESVESPGAHAIDALGGRILELFRVHAAVRAATLHLVDAHGRVAQAVATLGAETACHDDPLLREAVRSGEVVSVRDVPAAVTALVAVPLADVRGRVHAVVAVHELPFLVLHQDTLTLLAVLGGHLGDLLVRAHDAAHEVVKPRATRVLCASVSRSLVEARRYGIPAALAIVELGAAPGEHQPRVLACSLAAHRRITDHAEIVLGSDGTLRVVVLLKLTGAAGLASYLARLEQLARERARELGTRCEIRVQGWSLDDSRLPRDPRAVEMVLATLLNSADPSSESPRPRRHHGLVA